jgi:hypothetical protein
MRYDPQKRPRTGCEWKRTKPWQVEVRATDDNDWSSYGGWMQSQEFLTEKAAETAAEISRAAYKGWEWRVRKIVGRLPCVE